MTTEDIWPAVEHLAEVWGTSELVQKFLQQHPDRTDDTGSVTEGLRNIQAGSTLLTKMPLVTAMWEPLAVQLPMVQLTPELRAYLRFIAPLGHAVESTVGWVRSRLPLYPRIPVPQFASRGFRRSEELGQRLSWRQQVLNSGLNHESAPPGVALILGIDQTTIQSSSDDVLRAISSSAEWQRYSSVVDALTDEDIAILNAARNRVGVLLNPKKVDEYEPEQMERRHSFRREQVAAVLSELQNRPKELADAFDEIDTLIDQALVNVHGQLVVVGRPRTVVPTDLEVDGKEVSFKYEGDDAPGVGGLLRLDDPLVPEVVLTDGMGFGFNQTEGSWLRFTGLRLPGTQNAFLT
ncbi:hypothetical protein MYSE111917_14550 [Mycobacterium senriense]|uniref:Uncharacterized protein n=1 Tax=Mycobacterium senriense TaxID=2775496 RepID=A0ABM7T0H5_9MYCO|nr:hypothetical protein [Mycobacterium senriense]BCZ24054.1 hypothetical protein MTY59_39090 [Mycobacterium senriense]